MAITLRDLSDGQRLALADLLGSDRLPGPITRVTTARLVAATGLDGAAGLRDLVEALRGPLEDRRAARTARRLARDELWRWLEEKTAEVYHTGSLAGPLGRGPGGDPGGGLVRWVQATRLAGIPGGDVAAHRARLDGVLGVLRRLPADGTSLAALAADEFGNAHALDRGRTAAALVLDAAALSLGRPRPTDAESTRLLWEEVGVVPDTLSSTVLTLGLRPDGESQLAGWLRAMAEEGEPVVLTLSQLRRWPVPAAPAGETVIVVENPSLLREAASGGWRGPPLVCSSGRPTIAVVTLVRQLGARGATIRQHADFDGAGVAITAWLAERAGTIPWRMTAADYVSDQAGTRSTIPLRTPVPETPWDPALQTAMETSGVAIHEEEIRASLLGAAASFPAGGHSTSATDERRTDERGSVTVSYLPN
ncbi:MAG TPA: TIGR02679 family protein [Acidimicrobiales bacterium]|nr:TIGR02679 family protein [Acidimicrobiales bacterium]